MVSGNIDDRARFFEFSSDMMAIATLHSELLDLNPSWSRVLGYSTEELKTGMLWTLIHPDDLDASKQANEKVLSGSDVLFFENRYQCRDGSYKWLSWSCVIDREASRVYTTVRDITERKLAEERLIRQANAIRDMATPVLQVWDRVVAMPIIGVVDSERAAQAMETLLREIVRTHTQFAILDLTGVEMVDTSTANYLLQMVRAVALLGGTCIVSGISPPIASTMVGLGIEMEALLMFGTLKAALRHAIRECGAEVSASQGRERRV